MKNSRKINIVFIHYELPGQFLHLIRYLSKHSGYNVYGICHEHAKESCDSNLFKTLYTYQEKDIGSIATHHYVTDIQRCVLRAQAVTEVLQQCLSQQINFDIAVSHTGWGEALYFKDFYPETPLLGYVEFYFHATGADIGFDPSYPLSKDQTLQVKTLNSQLLLGMNECDVLITPTNWQKSLFPTMWQSKINVIHEGVDIDYCKPNEQVFLTLPDGTQLTRQDEVITYTARNLEPYRGFPTLIKAVERICQKRPNCHIIITGGDDVSYSKKLPYGECYREVCVKSVSIPNERVHFLGHVPYSTHIQILQLSSVHLYLTYPFVLSWSFIEAMACGCTIIASDTQPVMDILEPEINGIAVNFFDDEQIAIQVEAVLNHPQRKKHLGLAARKKIERHYQHHFAINHYLHLFQQLNTTKNA
jgi:glycosyltransferase involved in cell wall biosynthesis